MAISVVPPPISMIMLPEASCTGRPTPIAAASAVRSHSVGSAGCTTGRLRSGSSARSTQMVDPETVTVCVPAPSTVARTVSVGSATV